MENRSAFWQLKIFQKSLRESHRLDHLENLFGNVTSDVRCLIAGGTPALHYYVHQFRGNWTSLAYSQQEKDALENVVGEKVALLEPFQLPDATFDRVIIIDLLQNIPDDSAFIADCHRILRDSGVLLLNVPHCKKRGLATLMRHLLDVKTASTTTHRNGYTESELFDILKDGFDVEDTGTFSRFYMETMHLLISFAGGFLIRGSAPPDNEETRLASYYHGIYRYFSFTYPFEWLISKLDLPLFMTKGYLLTSRSKKRIWRPRKTPVLRDGRSIAEATLGGRIGTAHEF